MSSLAGCEALLEPKTKVSLAISHHGTRDENGVLPNYGEADAARVFVNDKGWQVALQEGVVVMTAAQVESCAGESFDFELPYGPFPEYQLAQDQDLVDFASVELPEGTYCKLRVEYGRYQSSLAEQAFDTPYKVEGHASIEGLTIYLAGTAVDPSGAHETANWKFETNQTSIVELDLSTADDGRPFSITGKEPGGRALTVAKTYDAYFRGVDFSDYDPEAISGRLLEILSAETYVIVGAQVF
ncbi:hypothetical protein SAMN02745121_06040 [Nannocystis exedens]|uniref:DUF4382 domain-containing protein n=1 Tax=Nannocystis exedens TaxID=54 RepID=A0A1I2EE56_9BACT|nr:hypothetical protein [Nannocystis exedens]PCC74780.1 hypothetical protein NAEX_07879 [Nannocystis exedens]SFE90999.1 hypothetical protein SAMN02745121_06040 [Nannocystis exedens]